MRMTTEAAATAEALTEPPRDLPNVPADRQALGLVRPYLGKAAWPTVFVAIAIVAAFATVTTLGAMHVIPLWLGLILNTFILYLDQTPLHEACHGNIAGKDSKILWLNNTIGFVCGAILLHEYKAFRYMHLAHHRDTNNPELDPDTWVAVQGPFKILWRCLTIVYWYHQYFWKHIAFAHIPGMRPLTLHIVVVYSVLYAIAFWLSVFGWWREVLALWIVPHILASALIIYFFAYLTHKPHEIHERYRDTNIFWFKGKVIAPVVNWLYMFQNFHLIHHLFPRVPFYLYPKAFHSLKPVLEKERAHIYEFGQNLKADAPWCLTQT
jgi:beta-carotene hydroxylase